MKLLNGQMDGYMLYQGATDRRVRAPVYVSKNILRNQAQDAVWVFVVGVAHHHTDVKKKDMVITYHEDTNKFRFVEWDHMCQWTQVDVTSSLTERTRVWR